MHRNTFALLLALALPAIAPLQAQEAQTVTQDIQAIDQKADQLFSQGKYAEALPLYQQVLAYREKTAGPEAVATAVSLNDVAKTLQKLGRNAQAEPIYQRALAIAEKHLGPEHPDTGGLLNKLAGLYESMGQYAKAEPLYLRALAIAEKTQGPEHRSTGTRLNNLAELYRAMGQYAKAEPLCVRALAIAEKAQGPEHPSTGTRLNNLANLYRDMGQYAQAEPLYLRALAIAEKHLGPEHPDTGGLLNNLAGLYESMGQYAKAEPLYVRALAIAEKHLGPEHPDTGVWLNNLAGLYRAMGQYAKAEPLYVRALAIAEKHLGPEHPQTGGSLNNLAVLYESMGQYAMAEPLYVRALAIAEKHLGAEHPLTGVWLNNLAGLYRAMGQYAKAAPLYVRALAIAEKYLGPEHPQTGGSLNNLAGLYRDMGQHTQAEPLYLRALAIAEKTEGPEPPSTGNTLNNLALLYELMGQTAKAAPLYQRAYRISLNANNPDVAFRVQSRIATFHHSQSRPELAIFYGKQAVNTMQALRRQSQGLNKDLQKSLLEKNQDIYKSLSGWLIAAGRIPEAQQVLAMLKEDEYFDFVRRDATADQRATRASLVGKEAEWDAKLQAAGSKLATLSKEAAAIRQKDESARYAAEKARLAELDAQLDAAGAEFAKTLEALQAAFDKVEDKGRYAELKGKALERDLTDVIGSLGKHVTLLQTIVMDDGVHLIVTTPEVRLARKATVTRAELSRQVNALLEVLKSPNQDPKPAAQALWKTLLAPVAADLQGAGTQTLMFSLDDVLRYVPMAALHDGGQYLAERYALALFTDAARENLKDAPKAQWRIAGLGLSESREGFDPLPSVQGELEGLVKSGNKGVLPGTMKLNAEFNRDNLRSALREKYPVLHIASHFYFDPKGDRDSFLLMGDGKLSLEEVRKGNAERKQGPLSFAGVDLLTLSACQTAVGGGKDANGREIEGFGVLAQTQGAKGVIATLWPVADESTSLLMQQMYRLRQDQKLSKAEALRQAQLALLTGKVSGSASGERAATRKARSQTPATFSADPKTPFAHPFYWAPFILMGNWL